MECCRVYWASHGCARPRDHAKRHVCDCGSALESWMPTYGEDAMADDPRVLVAPAPPDWDLPPGPLPERVD